MASMQERMIRAAKLDVALYEEVEADEGATTQAMAVVVITALAAGIGQIAVGGVTGVVAGALAALVGWVLWAALIYWIGTRLLPEPQTKADIGQLLRTIGFASSPGVFRIVGIVPGLGPLLVLAVNIWMLVAMVIAVRQALDYESTGRAIGVCLIGWLIQVLIAVLVISLFGGS